MGINFFIKKNGNTNSKSKIFYACVDKSWRKEDKYRYLDSKEQYRKIKWKRINPDEKKKYTWLKEGLHADFENFLPLKRKEVKEGTSKAVDVIFKLHSPGVNTARDAWAYNFSQNALADNMNRLIAIYNMEVDRWNRRENRDANLDSFVVSDDRKIKWSATLKGNLDAIYILEEERSLIFREKTLGHHSIVHSRNLISTLTDLRMIGQACLPQFSLRLRQKSTIV